MKLSIATGLMMAMATTEAFAPSKINSSPQSTALFAEEINNFLPKIDGKAAASLVAASFLAFSTVGVASTAIPAFVEPAHAAKVVVEEPTLSPKEAKKAEKAKAEALKKKAEEEAKAKKEAEKEDVEGRKGIQ